MSSPTRGEVWRVDFSPTRGHEQAGVRPALIVSDDRFNLGPSGLVIVLPLTTTTRGYPFHIEVNPAESGLERISFIMADQIRTVSKDRLLEYLGSIGPETLDEVDEAMRILLAL